MLTAIVDWIKHKATGKNVIISTLVAQSIFACMIFYTIPKLTTLSGGLKILDVLPTGYNLGYITSLFDKLGQQGRAIYQHQQLALDLFYPALFALSSALLMTYTLCNKPVLTPFSRGAILLPILTALLDYCENFCIFVMLETYPAINPTVAKLANFFTITKSLTTTIFFIILLSVLLSLVISRIANCKSRK